MYLRSAHQTLTIKKINAWGQRATLLGALGIKTVISSPTLPRHCSQLSLAPNYNWTATCLPACYSHVAALAALGLTEMRLCLCSSVKKSVDDAWAVTETSSHHQSCARSPGLAGTAWGLFLSLKSEGISLTSQGTRTRRSEGLSIGLEKHVKLELFILLLSAQDAYEDKYVCSKNGILELDGRDTKCWCSHLRLISLLIRCSLMLCPAQI